ncbi:putative nucleotide-binding alpha-beta plait domain-containing protein [Rosa chinensis]|uniref:Putative nucleotide-binding alpha-beta plait domain-containing protein n=1 Tax=Rosa chinensis TaxID=74649 RepID=A0A2P6QUR6_ROSCH|nr:polyadenylate-binding protein RBP47 [Rosa chinensis]PRQ37904.1 putative nucleotide-binding alpha-beta plait domain-containing protein [Rosa chinensis]
MNGAYCSSRPMRIGVATPKNHLDINNSTLHKDWYWLEVVDMQVVPLPKVLSLMASPIRQLYLLEGLILMSMRKTSRSHVLNLVKLSLKIPVGKACGFVQFANRKDAENAMNMLNATVIGKQTVRLSWGRSQGNKQWRSDSSNQWNNGGHYGGQGYGGYTNAAPQNPDLSMHAAAAVNRSS